MAGSGTGYPLTFRCAKCKRGDWRDRNRGTTWTLTDRVASPKRGLLMRSDREFRYRYVCGDCGHVGWTRHESARREWARTNKT